MELSKTAVTFRISHEMYFESLGHRDERFRRRHNRIEVKPSPEAWARYHAAVAGLQALEAYEGTMFGGPDYDTEVPEPAITYEFEYLETIEEWLERCRSIEADAPRPTRHVPHILDLRI